MSEDKGLARGLTNYGDAGFSAYLRRSFALSMGFSRELLDRPVIGIADTGSGFNNCHRGVPELIEAAKRGVLAAGGLPVVFPLPSLGEVFLSPTSLYFRNLMSMAAEEMIRGQPMDAVVLIGGCDKTIPALVMGALSADRPAILVPVGPMLTGRHQGERLGACTDCRRFWARYRAGDVGADEIAAIESRLAVTTGTCPVMGTASTMAAIVEALGLTLEGAATIPAVHADRLRLAEASGARAVALAGADIRPSSFVTPASVENALRVLLAIGGSTNGIIHLAAMAGRQGLAVPLERLNALSDETPVLVDLKPSGSHYMEDWHAAGGLEAVLRELEPLLALDVPTVGGRTLRERLAAPAPFVDRAIVRSRAEPFQPQGGLVALFGSLAPRGAILKRSAAALRLLEHEGRAVVFDGLDDLAQRIDDPALEVGPDDVLVLKNAGPMSAAAMPEAGFLPIPAKLAKAGVRDMLRISDARMSGTAYGSIVLHVTPEAAAGGPLAWVRDGDRIAVSLNRRRLDLLVNESELARRRDEDGPRPAQASRGYAALHRTHVLQADEGCDFDFLIRRPG